MSVFSKSKSNYGPGPQTSKLDANLLLLILSVLCIAFFLFTIYAVAKDNVDILYPDKSNPKPGRLFLLKYTIFDAKTCCTIFITLLSLILIRSHFILGFKPRIIYESKDVATDTQISSPIWLVQIKNVGLGAGVIISCKFRTNRNDDKFNFSHENILSVFAQKKITNAEYFLPRISKGYVFQPKDDKALFKITKAKISCITVLDMQIEFKGLLGGEYKKIIYLLPST